MIKIHYCGDCNYKLNAVILKKDIENAFNLHDKKKLNYQLI